MPLQKMTPPIMTQIKKDWAALVPSLKPAPSGKDYICRIVGPLMIRISFIVRSSKTYYAPAFEVLNFSNEEGCHRSLVQDLQGHIIWIAHRNKRYISIFEKVKDKIVLPLEGPISVTRIWEGHKYFLDNIKELHGDYTRSILENPPLIAAWAGREDLAREILDWSYNLHNLYGQKQEDPEWLSAMQERIADPEKLRRISQERIIEKKLHRIPQEPLIPE